MTQWDIFLFDFAIYKKCLLNEITDLKIFPFLTKYKIKQNIFWKLWRLSFGNSETEISF